MKRIHLLMLALVVTGLDCAAGQPASVPVKIRPILEARDFEARMSAVHSLPPNLTSDERQALCVFLLSRENRKGDHWLKNDVMDALCNQNDPPAELGKAMLAIYRDKRQDDVMRDYALQHLATWYERSQEKPQIQQALFDALHETQTSIGGTALLALHRLAKEQPGFDHGRIEQEALAMAGDERVGELARTTAFQVCAERRLSAVGPKALKAAQSARGIPLRIAAIACLGDTGGPEAQAYLQEVAGGSDKSLHLPAQAALKRMRKALSK